MGILLLVFFCVIEILRSNFLLHKKEYQKQIAKRILKKQD